MNHRLAGNALPEVLDKRRIEAPLLNPVLRKVDLWYCNGTATPCSVHECYGAGFGATNSHRARSCGDDADIEHNPGEAMERRGKKVRPAPTGSTVEVSIGIDIEAR